IAGSNITDGPLVKEQPRGDIFGFDVRTGKKLWTFHSVPQAGEFGHETWESSSADYTGNTNVWSMITVDETLGYVYLPFGTPTNDYYGAIVLVTGSSAKASFVSMPRLANGSGTSRGSTTDCGITIFRRHQSSSTSPLTGAASTPLPRSANRDGCTSSIAGRAPRSGRSKRVRFRSHRRQGRRRRRRSHFRPSLRHSIDKAFKMMM